jgi:hypothetical protein
LAALEQAGDVRLERLADLLRRLLVLAPEQIPPIDGQFDLNAMRARPAAPWVQDYVTGVRAASSPATTGQGKPGHQTAPSWIGDFINLPASSTFSSKSDSFVRARLVAALSAAFVVAAWLLLAMGAVGLAAPALLTAALVAGNTGHLAHLYWRKPEVVARRAIHSRLSTVQKSWSAAGRTLSLAERERGQIQHVYAQQCARIDRLIGKEQTAEQRQLAHYNQRRQQALDALQVQRHRAQQEEVLTVQRVESSYRERIGDIDRQLAAIQQGEATARRRLLEQRRQQFVTDFLSRQKIEKALIAGIGPGVKERLKQYGIVRVTDVTAARLAGVAGIGAARADVLLTWRQRVEALAWQAAPTKLDRRDERDVHRHHEQLHARLGREREQLERKLAKKISKVREQAARRMTGLAEQETRLEERHRDQIAEMRKRHRERVLALRSERTVVEKHSARFLAAVEQETNRLAQTQQRLERERTLLKTELDRYARASFPGYIRRAFLPR